MAIELHLGKVEEVTFFVNHFEMRLLRHARMHLGENRR